LQTPLFEMSPAERLRHALRQAFDQKQQLPVDTDTALLRDVGFPVGPRGTEDQLLKPDQVFSANWFVTKYFFLFKKNLSVTNIQFAELFALLRTHASYQGRDTHLSPHLQLLSRDDFRSLINHVLHDISLSSDIDSAIVNSAATFQDVFDRTILVAQFYGSCAVYLPPYVQLEPSLICGESGYIHSCGHLVYLRNVEKATKERFIANLEHHLDEHYTSHRRATLIPYSHEAFTDHDDHEREMLRGGLEDVKIHATKYFIGADALVDVLDDVQQRMGNRVWIPEPGPYSIEHDLATRDAEGADLARTIWIIADQEIPSAPVTVEAGRRFVIVYDQLFANKNRYHEFDENKPAWIDHTTLPHTLTGAMINITRPWDPGTTLVGDPFAGTGTSLFEAAKLPNVEAACSDNHPIAKQVVADNHAFFTQPVEWLHDYRTELTRIESDAEQFDREHNRRLRKSKLQERYEWAEDLVHRCVRPDAEPAFGADDVSALKQADLRHRLMFYLLLKAERRNARAFKSGDARWWAALRDEARGLRQRTDALLRTDEAAEVTSESIPAEGAEHLRFFQTRYSVGTTTRFVPIDRANTSGRSSGRLDQAELIREADALDFERACNVIVTDPPYGFNTEEGVIALGTLYRETLKRLLESLKPRRDGHLVVCLPEQSFIGRGTPWFTRRGAYIRLVFALAEDFGREVVRIGQVFPSRRRTAGPPYYWQSERALRRTILHFVLRPISRPQTPDSDLVATLGRAKRFSSRL
jgi:hypothetical protein